MITKEINHFIRLYYKIFFFLILAKKKYDKENKNWSIEFAH